MLRGHSEDEVGRWWRTGEGWIESNLSPGHRLHNLLMSSVVIIIFVLTVMMIFIIIMRWWLLEVWAGRPLHPGQPDATQHMQYNHHPDDDDPDEGDDDDDDPDDDDQDDDDPDDDNPDDDDPEWRWWWDENKQCNSKKISWISHQNRARAKRCKEGLEISKSWVWRAATLTCRCVEENIIISSLLICKLTVEAVKPYCRFCCLVALCFVASYCI